MRYSGAIMAARPTWTEALLSKLRPGAHVALLTDNVGDSIIGRRAGLELRDTILLLWPQKASFAFLFRKLFDEGTLDNLTSEHAGALNIAACRTQWKSEQERLDALPGSMPQASDSIGTFQTRDRSSENPEDAQNRGGRWPPNVLLIHGPTCRLLGETRVEGHKGYPNGPGGSSTQFSQKGVATTRNAAWTGYADADGMEVVPFWVCQPDCPAKLLDEHSGKTGSNWRLSKSGAGTQASTLNAYGEYTTRSDVSPNDSGGASRFYPQFASPYGVLIWLRALLGEGNDFCLLEDL
jgi:hypothetical protein